MSSDNDRPETKGREQQTCARHQSDQSLPPRRLRVIVVRQPELMAFDDVARAEFLSAWDEP